MCGRFTQTAWPAALAEQFRLAAVPELKPRYNVAPSTPVAAVRAAAGGERELALLRWGLIPFWAKDEKIGYRMINARAETVFEKPAYRAAARKRRCLIPADGFYEWQKRDGRKQPWYIHGREGNWLAFAGLWEHWQPEGGEEVQSCTILTTTPNELCKPIHDRMPVILAPDDFGPWLDPGVEEPEAVAGLLRPCPADWLAAHPVSTRVNNPRYDRPDCVEPVKEEGG